MNTRLRFSASWLVVVCFLFATVAPDDAQAFFDDDALKTTGIIMGITAGVALLVVLVVGTVRDLKKNKDPQEDEVWSRNPVIRTLGYRPGAFPWLGQAPAAPGDLPEKGLVSQQEIDAFLQGKVEAMGFIRTPCRFAKPPPTFTLGCMPGEAALSNPAPGPEGDTGPFSLSRTGGGSVMRGSL